MKKIVDSIQTLVNLAKSGDTLELQEKISELRKDVLELEKENVRLREELETYTKGEPCPKCKKSTWQLESSHPHPIFGNMGASERISKCSECGFSESYMHRSDR